MKVLNVNISLDSKVGGGTAERTYQLSRFLVKQGVECTALVMDLGTDAVDISSRAQGIKVITLPCISKRFYIPKFSWKKLTALTASVDVVHLINYWTLINILMYLAARKTKTPYVLCPAGALPIYGRSQLLKKMYQWLIGSSMFKRASGYIAITRDEALYFEKLGALKEKIVLIPNGVENFSMTEPCNFLQEKKLLHKPYILFVGRLNFIKGPDLLLSAFARLAPLMRDFDLVFAGPDDGMLGALQQDVVAYKLQGRVHFVGYVAGAEKFQLYNNATLLVIPSRQEAMSIVVLEAGILAKPVLMTDQCGFSELADQAGGVVVPAAVEGLEQGLKELLQPTASLQTMGNNLQKFVKQHYSWDIQVAKLIQFYKGILL